MEMQDSDDENSPEDKELAASNRVSNKQGYTGHDLELGPDLVNTHEDDEAKE